MGRFLIRNWVNYWVFRGYFLASSKHFLDKKAQSALEFFLNYGFFIVVVIVVLGVIMLILDPTGFGILSSSEKTQRPIGEAVVLEDVFVDTDGDVGFSVFNRTRDDVTIVGFSIGNADYPIESGSPSVVANTSKSFYVPRAVNCPTGACSLGQFSIKYASKYGLERSLDQGEVIIREPSSLTRLNFAGDSLVCAINNDVRVCSEGGGSGVDTNWQTSWSELDSNLKSTYLQTQNGALSLPSISGNSGKYLSTNGSALSWEEVLSGGGSGSDTNWQTSWSDFDSNLNSTYISKEYRREVNFFDEFDGATTGNDWTAVNSGTGAAESLLDPVTSSDYYGVIRFSTGTTATGRAALIRGTGSLLLGTGQFVIETRAQFPTLAALGNDYSAQFGLHDAAARDAVDGVYFQYDRNTYGSDILRCVTSSNSTRTVVVSTFTVNTSWHTYKIVVNSSGTQADFYVDGSIVCVNTTNIPTAASRATSPRIQIVKNSGTTARELRADYWYHELVFNTAR